MMTESVMPLSAKTLSPTELGRAIWTINAATMNYGIGDLLYTNSFMLLYFSLLGIPSERILFYLSLPPIIRILTLVPFSHWAERIGKVRLGMIGLSLGSLSMVILMALGSVPSGLIEPLAVIAMTCFGLGFGLYLNSWFPLLAAIIPEGQRGRFFGTMRFLYQTTAIVFTFIASWTLEQHSAIVIFQLFLAAAVIFRIFGTLLYGKIPELERRIDRSQTLTGSLVHAIGKPGYLPFCSYVFLLSLFTGSCTALFSLLAKDTLGLPQSQVLLIGNVTTFGSLLGFLAGGRLVDRIGTKLVFVLCHFSYAFVLLLFLMRDFSPCSVGATVGALALGFGLVQAASGVALTTEMLAVIPADNKPMATAVNLSLSGLGIALSGMFSSGLLKLGILSPTWSLFGHLLGPYDAILLFCGVMVMLLVVTLGLVPSVVKTTQWQ